jgi:hypothetical protein
LKRLNVVVTEDAEILGWEKLKDVTAKQIIAVLEETTIQ